jgi:hypothetical protein
VRVGAAQQVLAVQVLFGPGPGLTGAQQPAGVTRRNRFGPGIIEIFPRSSARLSLLRLSDPAMSSSSLLISSPRILASRTAASGLRHTTNRSPASGSRTSLTCMFPATCW